MPRHSSPFESSNPLRQLLLNRQFANPLAGGRKDRIADGGRHGWNAGLADAGGWSRAGHDMNVRLHGRFVETRHRIGVEVRLLDAAVGGRDFAHERDASPEYRRTFQL